MMTFEEWLKLGNDIRSIIYLGAILTKTSQKTLFESINSRFNIPNDWKKYCHHMTIAFRPTNTHNFPVLGEEISLIVTDISVDSKAIAVLVEPNTQLKMSPSQIPHITIATAPDVTPVYSNELIRKNKEKFVDTLVLNAFIGAKTNNGVMPERSDAALESF